MFLRRVQFIALICITVFLLIISVVIANIDHADEQQEVAICATSNADSCANIWFDRVRVKQ